MAKSETPAAPTTEEAQPTAPIAAATPTAAPVKQEAKPTAPIAAATPTAAPVKQEAKPALRTYHVTNSDGLNATIEAGSVDAAKYGVMRANRICDRGGMTWTITRV